MCWFHSFDDASAGPRVWVRIPGISLCDLRGCGRGAEASARPRALKDGPLEGRLGRCDSHPGLTIAAAGARATRIRRFICGVSWLPQVVADAILSVCQPRGAGMGEWRNGSAPALHAGGCRFESDLVHQLMIRPVVSHRRPAVRITRTGVMSRPPVWAWGDRGSLSVVAVLLRPAGRVRMGDAVFQSRGGGQWAVSSRCVV